MGIEAESAAGQPGVYQISQRADFFSVLVSIDTMNRRPLVNTRDEPHADANRYRRFHVIIGDSNMSEWATALKMGTTALVLDLIERGEAPQLEIAQPIDATKSISRDQNYDWIIELTRWPQDFRDRCAAALFERGAKVDARMTRKRIGFCANGKMCSTIWSATCASARSRRLGGEEVSAQRVAGGGETCLERSVAAGDRPRVSQHRSGAGLYYELLRQGSMRRVVTEEEIKARHLFSARKRPAPIFADVRSRVSTMRSNRFNGMRLSCPTPDAPNASRCRNRRMKI